MLQEVMMALPIASNLQRLVPPILPEGVQRQLPIGSSWSDEKVIGLAQAHPAQSRSRTHLFLPSLPATVRFLGHGEGHLTPGTYPTSFYTAGV